VIMVVMVPVPSFAKYPSLLGTVRRKLLRHERSVRLQQPYAFSPST
jgi:hypothetical protein